MKIAVPYDNDTVFQHFGHSQFFKIYDVADQEICGSKVISPDEGGHAALAGMLGAQGVDVLICGGIGGGALNALAEYGISVCGGVSGSADDAVRAYLRGELVADNTPCSHHHDEEGGCPHSGSCGSASGGCGGCSAPAITGKNVGKTCRVHYQGTFDDGTQFDSSYDRGEPLEFTCGSGMMIRGFDAAVADMNPGETKNIHLMPEEAYGPFDPNAIIKLPLAQLNHAEELSVGQRIILYDAHRRQVPVTVVDKTDTDITFDANHEMAGKELNFKIELVEVR